MRVFDYFGGDAPQSVVPVHETAQRRRVIQDRLGRVLAFTGKTIDDVINCPMARNQVRGYWKLSRQIDRSAEIGELERQWNASG
jgi:hypothetical protein